MAPDARMDDGRLDLVTRQRCSPGIILRAFHAAAQARRASAAVSGYEQGQRFIIQSDTPLSVQMDGDPLPGVKWMEVGLAPGRLRLITPQ
jgi:diacylglycerol kinase family enzyme